MCELLPFMASGGSDRNAKYALSKLLKMGTVAEYESESRPTTLGEAFSLARIADACFEDERSSIAIAKSHDLNARENCISILNVDEVDNTKPPLSADTFGNNGGDDSETSSPVTPAKEVVDSGSHAMTWSSNNGALPRKLRTPLIEVGEHLPSFTTEQWLISQFKDKLVSYTASTSFLTNGLGSVEAKETELLLPLRRKSLVPEKECDLEKEGDSAVETIGSRYWRGIATRDFKHLATRSKGTEGGWVGSKSTTTKSAGNWNIPTIRRTSLAILIGSVIEQSASSNVMQVGPMRLHVVIPVKFTMVGISEIGQGLQVSLVFKSRSKTLGMSFKASAFSLRLSSFLRDGNGIDAGVTTGATLGSGFGLRVNLNNRRLGSLRLRPDELLTGRVEAVLAVTNFESMSVKFAICDCRHTDVSEEEQGP
ncbi:hypothetical protein Tco_1057991 [Tanacetum coccineum]|uniref:Uncharacterized protein n=1 Tax=Tanacetum coccineum TaxID=301880 RepID=A0ABQ5H752_9ASTR